MREQTPVRYVYDGSFEGLMCCVYESVYTHLLPQEVVCEADAQPCLFEERRIVTQPDKAARVFASISQKIGPAAEELVRDTYFSCAPGRELLVLRFLHFGYKTGKSAPYMLGHPAVAPLVAAQKFLRNEAHLSLEFLRFEDTGEALVAVIEPKNFVLPYLAHHFCTRFACETFLIWDKTHAAALVWQNGAARIVPLEELTLAPETGQEAQFKALWKQFYNTISIKERENPVCRRTHCPKRYWAHMTELQDMPDVRRMPRPGLEDKPAVLPARGPHTL